MHRVNREYKMKRFTSNSFVEFNGFSMFLTPGGKKQGVVYLFVHVGVRCAIYDSF